MAWDVEGTKRALLEAASAEFSAHGLAGARVDRIAGAAGVNKERLYQYFGNKEALFATVLEHRIESHMASVRIQGSGMAALADYVGQVFDRHTAEPELARLVFWEGLERTEPVAWPERSASAAEKARRLREALPALGDAEARQVLITTITLCDAFLALGTSHAVYRPEGMTPEAWQQAHRAAIIAAVTGLAESLGA